MLPYLLCFQIFQIFYAKPNRVISFFVVLVVGEIQIAEPPTVMQSGVQPSIHRTTQTDCRGQSAACGILRCLFPETRPTSPQCPLSRAHLKATGQEFFQVKIQTKLPRLPSRLQLESHLRL